MSDPTALLEPLLELHSRLRDEVVAATEHRQVETLTAVDRDSESDTIYALDVVAEAVIARFAEALGRQHSFVLVAEGAAEGAPYGGGGEGAPSGEEADWVIIVDPIDGTRGLMYQKRPGWILTGVAPYRGDATSLADITVALQTEIPLVKQHLSDSLWVIGDGPPAGERLNRLSGARTPIAPRPSQARTIAQGFGGLSRFFPGRRGILAEIDDAVVERVLGELPPGRAVAFEDQYISSAGQLYELMMGHDRWTADLRPLVWATLGQRGLCCHPYDLATIAIARAAGVEVTDGRGRQLDAPLDVETDVAWIGYANAAIRAQVEPVLQQLLTELHV